MRGTISTLTALMCLWGVQAIGLTTIRTSYGPKDTMDRLETEIWAKGRTVFARIDHAAGAPAVGLSLRPTEVLIFGNAKGRTPLMQSMQTIGIDLPLKALVVICSRTSAPDCSQRCRGLCGSMRIVGVTSWLAWQRVTRSR